MLVLASFALFVMAGLLAGLVLEPEFAAMIANGYGDTVDLSNRIASALVAHGVQPGDTIAILSSNDPIAFTALFGISRAGAVWCAPVCSPRSSEFMRSKARGTPWRATG